MKRAHARSMSTGVQSYIHKALLSSFDDEEWQTVRRGAKSGPFNGLGKAKAVTTTRGAFVLLGRTSQDETHYQVSEDQEGGAHVPVPEQPSEVKPQQASPKAKSKGGIVEKTTPTAATASE